MGSTWAFVDSAAEAGLLQANVAGGRAEKWTILESTGAGACLFDAEGDGDLDLYQVKGGRLDGKPAAANVFYRNDGQGHFRDATAEAGLANTGWGGGCAAADIDNDGDSDLLVTNFGPNVLYRNEGDGHFRDVTTAAGLVDDRYSLGAAFFDADGYGDLDLYVANYLEFDPQDPAMLARRCRWKSGEVMCGPRGFRGQADAFYRNRGDGTFEPASLAAGIGRERLFGMGVVAGDLDSDGDRDLFVASDSQANQLLVNDGQGHFTDQAMEAGVALSGDGREQSGMGTELGDIDGDGDEDLIVTNFSDDYPTLYRNDGNLLFTDISAAAGLDRDRSSVGWGAILRDFDNDGDLDLFIACGHVYVGVEAFDPVTRYLQRNLLFENNGHGAFREVGGEAGSAFAALGAGRGVAVGDLDNDGDLDIVVINNEGPPRLLRNESGKGRHFLQVSLQGTRSPRDGNGARLILTAGGRKQFREARRGGGYLSSSDQRVHFGLGEAERVQKLEVLWPSGQKQTFEDLPADCEIKIEENRGLLDRLCRVSSPPAGKPMAGTSASTPPTPVQSASVQLVGPLPRPALERRELLLAAQAATREVLAGRYAAGSSAFEALLAALPAWNDPAIGPQALGFGNPEAYRAFLAKVNDNLGVAYLRSERLPACIAAVDRAIELEPNRSQFRHNLGICLFNSRRFPEAVEALAAGSDLPEPSAGIRYDLHRALAAAGRCAEAESNLATALADAPDAERSKQGAELFYLLGSCRAAAGEPGAEAHFRQALARDPGQAKAHFKLRTLLQRRGYAPGAAYFAARWLFGRLIH